MMNAVEDLLFKDPKIKTNKIKQARISTDLKEIIKKHVDLQVAACIKNILHVLFFFPFSLSIYVYICS